MATFTAILAFSTRALARSSATDQRSQWRPIVIPAEQTIDESIDGELRIEPRNVGRGPALGLQGELWRGNAPYAASIPGQENIAALNDSIGLRFRVPDPPAPRGSILSARLSNYEGEQWHHNNITMSIRRPEEDDGPLLVDKRRRIRAISHGEPGFPSRRATGRRASKATVGARVGTHPRLAKWPLALDCCDYSSSKRSDQCLSDYG